jgi:hypothetical protein
MNPDSNQFDNEYALPGDEPSKKPDWHKDRLISDPHLRRRSEQPTTKSLDEYYGDKYQYGKRPKGWKP